MSAINLPSSDLIQFKDSANLDAFSRLRVSQPQGIFDSQFTYDLNPLSFEQITSGSGATITHDTTNRNAIMTFSSTPNTGKAYLQSYQYHRYQPGKSQKIAISFNFKESIANCLKFIGYSDGVNGVEFQTINGVNQFVIYSTSSNGNQTVVQSKWNMDTLDGNGPSGITLDISKAQIYICDLQALYTGRVRVGFDLNGKFIYVHQFNHSNLVVSSYIQSANLPIKCGMTCTGTVSTTMTFTCCTVVSEGGSELTSGVEFSKDAVANAANGTPVHLLSIRPKATFNGFTNRVNIGVIEANFLANGANPVFWQLVIGQAISGTTAFADINTTYSASEFNTAGTLSGVPAIIIDSGYVVNGARGESQMSFTARYPITLDAAGAARANGTVTVIITGVTGASNNFYGSLKWREIR